MHLQAASAAATAAGLLTAQAAAFGQSATAMRPRVSAAVRGTARGARAWRGGSGRAGARWSRSRWAATAQRWRMGRSSLARTLAA